MRGKGLVIPDLERRCILDAVFAAADLVAWSAFSEAEAMGDCCCEELFLVLG